MASLAALERALGISLNDPSLLEKALIHSSYVNENPGVASGSNERLEFLGDAVLGLVVAEKLYQDFPQFNEGEMTRLRAALVRGETLSRMAEAFNLGDYLCLGKGEESSGGRHKPANLAGAFEAVIAAVFLDRGIDYAKDYILRMLNSEIQKAINQRATVDFKSQLQEIIQSRYQLTPTYQVTATTGPDHAREFTVEVKAGDITLGKGAGNSKKAAETEAARLALEQLQTDFTR